MSTETKIRREELDSLLVAQLNDLDSMTSYSTQRLSWGIGSTTNKTTSNISLVFSNEATNPPTIRWNSSLQQFEYDEGTGTFISFGTASNITGVNGVLVTPGDPPTIEPVYGSTSNTVTQGSHESNTDPQLAHGGFVSSITVVDNDYQVKSYPNIKGSVVLKEGDNIVITPSDPSAQTPEFEISATAVTSITTGFGTSTGPITFTGTGFTHDAINNTFTFAGGSSGSLSFGSGPVTPNYANEVVAPLSPGGVVWSSSTDIGIYEFFSDTRQIHLGIKDTAAVKALRKGGTSNNSTGIVTLTGNSEILLAQTVGVDGDFSFSLGSVPTVKLAGSVRSNESGVLDVYANGLRMNDVGTASLAIGQRGTSGTPVTNGNVVPATDQSSPFNYSGTGGPTSIARINAASLHSETSGVAGTLRLNGSGPGVVASRGTPTSPLQTTNVIPITDLATKNFLSAGGPSSISQINASSLWSENSVLAHTATNALHADEADDAINAQNSQNSINSQHVYIQSVGASGYLTTGNKEIYVWHFEHVAALGSSGFYEVLTPFPSTYPIISTSVTPILGTTRGGTSTIVCDTYVPASGNLRVLVNWQGMPASFSAFVVRLVYVL